MTNPYFEIRRSPVHGRGAFALKKIRKGTRLVEYTGEKISHAESDIRYDETKMKAHHTFLFTLDSRTVVDGAVNGNESRFINHSCAPNCDATIEKRHIWIEANRTIQPGEEIAYDYNFERTEKMTEADEKLYVCRCGAPECRGTILSAKTTYPRKTANRGRKKRSAVKNGTKGRRKKGSAR